MSPDDYTRLKKRLAELKATSQRLNGRLEEVMERLGEIGFRSTQQAATKLAELKKRIKAATEELITDVERFERDHEKAKRARQGD